jgi:hypothetical protein
MSFMKFTGFLGKSVASIALAGGLALSAAPASAVVLTSGGGVQNFNTSASILYEGQTVSYTGAWTLQSVAANLWSFAVTITNTSSAPVGPVTFDPARLVSWGFDTTPTATAFTLTTAPAGWDESGGLGVMNVDHCAYAGPNCAGNANAGITPSDGGQLFEFTFVSTESSITLDNFLVRFQSIGINSDGSAVIPLPAAAWLMLAGLGGLGLMSRRKAKAA